MIRIGTYKTENSFSLSLFLSLRTHFFNLPVERTEQRAGRGKEANSEGTVHSIRRIDRRNGGEHSVEKQQKKREDATPGEQIEVKYN